MSDELREMLEALVKKAIAEGVDVEEMKDSIRYEYAVRSA